MCRRLAGRIVNRVKRRRVTAVKGGKMLLVGKPLTRRCAIMFVLNADEWVGEAEGRAHDVGEVRE